MGETRSMKRKGYTITEILVVTAIIITLIAIIIPIVSSAKDRAKDTVCTSNLRQLYLATMMYKDENEGWPIGLISEKPFVGYLGNTVLKCPAADHAARGDRNDYILTIEPDPKIKLPFPGDEYLENKNLYNDIISCREKRGDVFPVVVDKNHVKLSRRLPDSRVIFVRLNGQIETKPFYFQDFSRHSENLPCHYSLRELNL